MGNKVKSINLAEVNIVTKLQYLGLIIGIVFTFALTVADFFTMKEQISDLKSRTSEIDLKSSKELKETNNKLLQDISLLNQIDSKIREDVAELKGQLKQISTEK